MKRSFTLFATVLSLVTASYNSYGQCLTGGSFTASTNNTFDVNAEAFTGDFGWTSGSSGSLQSTGVDLGSVKKLTSSTFYLPATETTIAWSFNLSGTANCETYVVRGKYFENGIFKTVDICSGGSLPTTGTSMPQVFAAVAPSELIGKNFQMEITFTSTSTGAKVLLVDNFKTNAVISQTILPVNITYFGAAADAGKIKLTWLVSAESNVNRYEIERSANGKKWAKIAQVASAGVVQYTFVDATFSTGSNYYRLKAVDNDGSYKYSSVVLYKVGRSGIALRAYPSPAGDVTTIQHDKSNSGSAIDVLTVEGRVIKTIKPAIGEVETTISLASMKPGLYFIRYVNTDGEAETLKLIKQ